MAYIFRLPTEGRQETGDGWTMTQQYDENAIDSIRDPQVSESRREITSIPSPFARFDLVRTAFEWVATHELEGNTMYHKLVSDALDLGQILFKYKYFERFLRVESWEKQDLDNLLNREKANDGKLARQAQAHQQLASTLELFMEQDCDEFNFKPLKHLYFLHYKGPGAPAGSSVIIGGTSPLTLFVTPANNLEFVGKTITFGDDIPFDAKYRALHRRDFQYIRYIFAIRERLKKELGNFELLFKGVNIYLERVRDELGNFPNSRELDPEQLESFYLNECVSLGHEEEQRLELFGVELRCAKFSQDTSMSDFQIKPTREGAESFPLVLSNFAKESCEKWNYFGEQKWDASYEVPYTLGNTPLERRLLPGLNMECPWLTTSDFLEDSLVKQVATSGSNEDFFYGGYTDGRTIENGNMPDYSYCLPLTPLFFKYFTAESLMRGQESAGDPVLKLSDAGLGQIKAELKIPVKRGDYITFMRNYYETRTAPDISARSNSGSIDVYGGAGCTLAMHPPVKSEDGNGKLAKYRVLLVSLDRGAAVEAKLEFYGAEGNTVDPACWREYPRPQGEFHGIVYSIEGEDIEAIRMVTPRASGMIIPRLVKEQRGHAFDFAVDLGTSNTHIAYRRDDGGMMSFDIGHPDKQLRAFHCDYEGALLHQLIYDSLPEVIGEGKEYSFPIRTALAKLRGDNSPEPFASGSASFGYEHFIAPSYLELSTNIKWGVDEGSRANLRCYIASLCYLIRGKVLLNGGDLKKTQIVWFYPHSMTQNLQGELEKIWKECYVKYFGEDTLRVMPLVEAAAPYWYFKQRNQGRDKAVNIDIGGGTVDVAYAGDGRLRLVSSFRFGANNLYWVNRPIRNPLINFYLQKVEKILEKWRKDDPLIQVLNSLKKKEGGNANPDLASFFFTLGRRGIYNFAEELRANAPFRLLFLAYYSAILYHVFHLLKASGFSSPRYVSFSGNGSRILDIIFGGNSITFQSFTQQVAAKIYGDEVIQLNVEKASDPKELTCIGGLQALHDGQISSDRDREVRSIESILLGVDSTTVLTQAQRGQYTYETVEGMKEQVLVEVQRFVEFFMSLDAIYPFDEYFGIGRKELELLKSGADRDLDVYLNDGIRSAERGSKSKDDVVETLFFYPIQGLLDHYTQTAVDIMAKN